jgi:hypothetical protein
MARDQFDYEPKTIHELDDWNNSDPVKDNTHPSRLGLGGQPDPMRHLKDPYVPLVTTPEKTSSQKDI